MITACYPGGRAERRFREGDVTPDQSGAEHRGEYGCGCPVTVWDGPYGYRCGLGGKGGVCARHGRFAPEPNQGGAGAEEAQPWRVGRKVGRTVYSGDTLIGLMDTPGLARIVVDAVNGTPDQSDAGAEERSVRYYREQLAAIAQYVYDLSASLIEGYRPEIPGVVGDDLTALLGHIDTMDRAWAKSDRRGAVGDEVKLVRERDDQYRQVLELVDQHEGERTHADDLARWLRLSKLAWESEFGGNEEPEWLVGARAALAEHKARRGDG